VRDSDPWSNIEVRLIVADYFNMLTAELKGEAYSKTEHRRALLVIPVDRYSIIIIPYLLVIAYHSKYSVKSVLRRNYCPATGITVRLGPDFTPWR